MPQREVELVRRFWEIVRTNELDQLDDLVDPAYQWDCAAERPGVQVRRGREEVKAFIRAWADGWDEYCISSEGLIDVDQRVLHFVHLRARREGNRGVRVEQPAALVHTLAEGKLVRTEGYFNRADALKAVCLSS